MKPHSQNEVMLNLEADESSLPNRSKNAVGLIGVDFGVIDLNILDPGKMGEISETNKHKVIVDEGTTLDLSVSGKVTTVAGGHRIAVGVYKKNARGNFEQVQKVEGTSGSFLGLGNTWTEQLDTLRPGEYEIIMFVEEGATLGSVVNFSLKNQVLKDYRNILKFENSRIKGANVLEGQDLGAGDRAKIHSINVQGSSKVYNLADGDALIQGKYGQLTMRADGTYDYTPDANPHVVGKVEVFDFTFQNEQNNFRAKGTLSIRLNEQSIQAEWDVIEDHTTEPTIIELQDEEKNVTGASLNTKRTETYYDGSEGSLGRENFKTKPFAFKDTGDVLELSVWSEGKVKDVNLPMKLVNKQGKVVQTKEITVKNGTKTEVLFTGVPTGEYTVEIDKNAAFSPGTGVTGLGADTIHVKGTHNESIMKPTRIKMHHNNWGTYEGVSLQTVRGDLNTIQGNNLGSDATKTDLYVYGYQLAADGKTVQASSPDYHRVPHGKSIKIGTETGYLTIDSAGKYTFDPAQQIASYGRQDRVKYRVDHYSGKSDEAELVFNIQSLLNTTVNDDIITSTTASETVSGKGGSDTLIYSIIDAKIRQLEMATINGLTSHTVQLLQNLKQTA